eukprot:s6089_g2.t1
MARLSILQYLRRAALIATCLRLLAHALKQLLRNRALPLRNWFVTEFRWPREEGYWLAISNETDETDETDETHAKTRPMPRRRRAKWEFRLTLPWPRIRPTS